MYTVVFKGNKNKQTWQVFSDTFLPRILPS